MLQTVNHTVNMSSTRTTPRHDSWENVLPTAHETGSDARCEHQASNKYKDEHMSTRMPTDTAVHARASLTKLRREVKPTDHLELNTLLTGADHASGRSPAHVIRPALGADPKTFDQWSVVRITRRTTTNGNATVCMDFVNRTAGNV